MPMLRPLALAPLCLLTPSSPVFAQAPGLAGPNRAGQTGLARPAVPLTPPDDRPAELIQLADADFVALARRGDGAARAAKALAEVARTGRAGLRLRTEARREAAVQLAMRLAELAADTAEHDTPTSSLALGAASNSRLLP